MNEKANRYVVATIRPWNIRIFHEIIGHYPGDWLLVSRREDLTLSLIRDLSPRYVFFPHWSWKVPSEVLNAVECVCFHETDLPYGRGGSPIQNLIARGHRQTVITAFRMVEEMDAGPVYLKRPLSLEGVAEEIYLRAARTVAEMIREIVMKEPEPVPQEGEAVVFDRRRPEESRIPEDVATLEALFDHIRMLDACGYPRAYLEVGAFRYEFSRPVLRTDAVEADVRVTRRPEGKRKR